MSKRKTAEEVPQEPQEATKKTRMSADMELDENLHSRQIAVYGREVMKRMAASSVLVSGANGTGVEIGGCRVRL